MLKKIKNLVFDLDDTLYPASLGYKELSYGRIPLFFQEKMGTPFEEHLTEAAMWKEKGGTSRGFLAAKGVDMETLVAFACDIDMSKVSPNPALAKMLSSLPHRKIIYTDANRKHADETLDRLGLSAYFDDIFTILEGRSIWKHEEGAFEQFINFYNIAPDETIIFEDNIHNLEKAKKAGLSTVLINEQGGNKPDFCDFIFNDINTALKLFV